MAALPRRATCLALGILALTLTTPATFAWLTGAAVGPRATRTAHARPATDEVPAGQIIVRGRIDYIDRDIDIAHSAVGLRVEIWDQDKGFPDTSSKLGEARTDANGFFASGPLPNQDRDAPGGEAGITGQDIFLKLFTDNGDVKLLQLGTNREFVWQSYDLDKDDGIQRNVKDGAVTLPRLVVQGTTRDVEALWTFVGMASAWTFMQSASGTNPGKVTGYWSKDSQVGPLYDPQKRELMFRSDTAGYDDVVIQHTAYALIHNIYGTLPTPWLACTAGPEAAIKTEIDPACALVQGFATFLPLAVDPRDTNFESQVVLSLNLDSPGPVAPGWSNGDRVPGRVAGAFWDLYEHDQTVEEFDTFNATFADIWEVFTKKNPTTFAEWWAGWKALGKDSCGAVGSLYQNSIDYSRGLRVSPIPDVVLDEDQSTVVNLAMYVTNADCPPDRLKLTILDYGAPEAGVELIAGTLMISVTPQANWFGQTTVRVLIADGPSTVNTTFKVIVNSVNDCPRIAPRILDPGSVRYGETITINLATHGTDVETTPALLQWRADIEPQYRDLSVAGNGTTQLVFSLSSSIIVDYSALVDIVLRDADGCEVRQPIALNWTERPNQPPLIWMDRLVREYQAPVNTTIHVDLTDVAGDAEDGPDPLEWFVDNTADIDATVLKTSKRTFDFIPKPDYLGSTFPELVVKDSKGLQATAGITLTWVITNAKPVILRNLLLGKTVGASHGGRPSPAACYPLANKATDADDPVTSLLWFLRDYNTDNLTVTGQGTQAVCLRPRAGFVGCETARFLVRDPKGGTDSHEVTTCWREIKILLPYLVKPPQSAQLQLRRNGR